MSGLFITGSGTDVGKTYVSGLLAMGFKALGTTVSYIKPVQTGCERTANGNLVAPDVEHVVSVMGDETFTVDALYKFEPACSPHLAAKLAKEHISLDVIIEGYKHMKRRSEITIVEGAGGVLVPLNETDYMTDLIAGMNIPAVLVVTPGLGTLNHTFLSLEVLKQRGISTAGVVINNAGGIKRDFIYNDNVEMIRQSVHPRPCLEVEYRSDVNQAVKDFCYALKREL
ncbi:MAG: dethiobiotin synthase [Chitinispirillaceae bacterium]